MGIPDHLTCLLRNLYSGQEATVTTGRVTKNWFRIGKGVHHGYILSPWLFNLYAEYIMWNARLDDSQAGIKITGRNINNLRYANNATLMAESEEELKSFLMKMMLSVVLEKTLESPLNSKEIKPLNPKGNQPWIFLRRTDAEAEAPVLWSPDVKSWLTGEDPDAGKDWRQEEKGMTEWDGWMASLTQWTWVQANSGR